MNPYLEQIRDTTRRHFLKQTFAGLGGVALGSLVNPQGFAQSVDPMAPKMPHFPARPRTSSTST